MSLTGENDILAPYGFLVLSDGVCVSDKAFGEAKKEKDSLSKNKI